jgi:transmembrane 9 superfamily protein 2/4
VELKVVKLDSVKTQLPYGYYSLPFCVPADFEIEEAAENLGEILSGDLIQTSGYEVRCLSRTASCNRAMTSCWLHLDFHESG